VTATVLVLCPGCSLTGTPAQIEEHWRTTLCLSGAAPARPQAVYMGAGN
jgi:hypothetical protein